MAGGIPPAAVMSRAGWTSYATFLKFYNLSLGLIKAAGLQDQVEHIPPSPKPKPKSQTLPGKASAGTSLGSSAVSKELHLGSSTTVQAGVLGQQQPGPPLFGAGHKHK